MDTVISWVKKDFPEMYIKNIEIGNGYWDTFFLDINLQVESLAKQVAEDPNLKNGILIYLT